MTQQDIINKISKKATLFKVGGFRPSNNIKSSWFGKVLVGKEDEEWPKSNGNAMTPLLQINLSNITELPDSLDGIEFITVFIDSDNYSDNLSESLLIRTYQNIEELISLNTVDYISGIKPFQLESYKENDCPSWDDCPISIPEEFEDDYETLFENKSGIKIGGWPSLIQGEIFWESDNTEFVFQIDSIEKANWQWGDGGVAYFGKNPQTNDWFFEWQCY